MSLVDDVHAAARTIAQLTHMTQDDVGLLLDLVAYVDTGMDEAAKEKPELRGAQAAHFRDLLCASPYAKGMALCPKRKPKVDLVTGKARR